MRLRHALTLTIALLCAACAGRNRDTAAAGSPERNVMTITQIQEGAGVGITNLYDLIQRYHPEWMRTVRASATAGTATPTIWIDQQRMGSLTVLRTMPVTGVSLLRYLTPPEARGELGFDNPGGAIVVSMR